MDPLSVTAAIAGLVGLALQATKATTMYPKEAKEAKQAANELLAELGALQSGLSQLENLIKIDTNHKFSDTSVLVMGIKACRSRLSTLCGKLDGIPRSWVRRMSWPLNKIEHQEVIQGLKALTQWIQFAVNVDAFSLLSKTSNQVIDVLSNQLR